MNTKKLALLACCTAVSLSSYTIDGMAAPKKTASAGAWKVVVTLRADASDCTTAAIVPDGTAGGRNPFPTFYTFHEGGTLSEYGSRAAPSYRTPGHGVWKSSKKGALDARYTFLIFDGNGFETGTVNVTDSLTVSANSRTLSGTARYVLTDPSGNTIPFCATIAGEAIAF